MLICFNKTLNSNVTLDIIDIYVQSFLRQELLSVRDDGVVIARDIKLRFVGLVMDETSSSIASNVSGGVTNLWTCPNRAKRTSG